MKRGLSRLDLLVFETPLLIHPRKAEVIGSFLAARRGGEPAFDVANPPPAMKPFVAPPFAKKATQELDRFNGEPRGPKRSDAWGGTYIEEWYRFAGGVALISIEGALVNRGAYVGAPSGLASYEGIRAQIGMAAAAPDVKQIVLDLDTPGGEGAGAFELAESIRGVAAQKPIFAVVNSMAASAGYAIASACSHIVTQQSGLCGSIGVVMLHVDQSKALDKMGLAATFIFAGDHKVDGNSLEPLPDSVKREFQAEVDKMYGDFVATVVKGRPKLTDAAVRATQAQCYTGQDAVDVGLADKVATLGEVIDDLCALNAGARRGQKIMPAARLSMSLKGTIVMAVKLYKPGESHAGSLIAAGKVDKTSDWSFSAEDGDALLGDDGKDWDAYAQFHLGEDDAETDKTKARWKYPYGKGGKVYRSGLIAAKQRAAQQGEKDIEDAAGRLIDKIDNQEKAEAAMALDIEAARKAGLREGALAERERIGAILRAPEAEGRAATALTLALDNDMAAEAAIKVLGSVPKAAEASRGGRLDALVPRPDVRPDGGDLGARSDLDRGRLAALHALGRQAS